MKKNSFMKRLAIWLDVIFLLPGMALISFGALLIFRPAGFIVIGVCFIVLAFFIGKKQASGGDS